MWEVTNYYKYYYFSVITHYYSVKVVCIDMLINAEKYPCGVVAQRLTMKATVVGSFLTWENDYI